MLGGAREYYEHYYKETYGNHKCWLETAEEIADIEYKSHRYKHTHHHGKCQRNTIAITLGPQRLPLLAVVLLHHHGAQERCNEEDGEQTSDGVGIPMELPTRQQLTGEGQHKGEHQRNGGRGEDGIDNGVDRHLSEQTFPFAILLTMGAANGECVKGFDELSWQMTLKFLIGRCGESDHVRSEEGCDDRYCHNNRIKEMSDNAKRQSQRGDDEREFTDLRHRETATHGRLQRLAAKHERYGAEHTLTDDDGEYQTKDRQGVFYKNLRIDKHTYRHEEHGSEEVLDRFYKFLDALGLDSLGKNTTHDKCSECRTEAYLS